MNVEFLTGTGKVGGSKRALEFLRSGDLDGRDRDALGSQCRRTEPRQRGGRQRADHGCAPSTPMIGRAKEAHNGDPLFDKERAAMLFIEPCNDFLSEGAVRSKRTYPPSCLGFSVSY